MTPPSSSTTADVPRRLAVDRPYDDRQRAQRPGEARERHRRQAEQREIEVKRDRQPSRRATRPPRRRACRATPAGCAAAPETRRPTAPGRCRPAPPRARAAAARRRRSARRCCRRRESIGRRPRPGECACCRRAARAGHAAAASVPKPATVHSSRCRTDARGWTPASASVRAGNGHHRQVTGARMELHVRVDVVQQPDVRGRQASLRSRPARSRGPA